MRKELVHSISCTILSMLLASTVSLLSYASRASHLGDACVHVSSQMPSDRAWWSTHIWHLVVLAVDRQPSKAQMADQMPLLPIVHKIRSARPIDMPPGSGDEINACTSQDN